MQRRERGPYQVRALAGVEHEEAELVDEPEVRVQGALQLVGLGLSQLACREVEHLLAQQLQDDLRGGGEGEGDSLRHICRARDWMSRKLGTLQVMSWMRPPRSAALGGPAEEGGLKE